MTRINKFFKNIGIFAYYSIKYILIIITLVTICTFMSIIELSILGYSLDDMKNISGLNSFTMQSINFLILLGINIAWEESGKE